MAPPRKKKNTLFSAGVLANTRVETPENQEEEDQRINGGTQPPIEEDDPLFGNTKRILSITQQAGSVTDTSGYPLIAIEKLLDNPYQPRRRMNQKRLERLAHEIREYGFKGVLLARVHPDDSQNFQLVYGHRRREAAKLAGLQTLPVMIDNTINDHEMKFLALNENILRDDLTPIDEGYSFAAMLVEMSQDAVAARMGVSRGYIRNRVDILKAPEDVQDMVEEKPDTMKAVVYLKDVQEDDIRTTVIQALMNEEVTINQIKVLIENLRQAKSTPSMAREEPVPSSHTQNGKDEQHQTEDIQSEKERTRTPTTHLIEQSKEQTEAATDKTKIQTFIKYLNKYNGRLDSRQMTPDEHAALCTLADVVQGILVRHS